MKHSQSIPEAPPTSFAQIAREIEHSDSSIRRPKAANRQSNLSAQPLSKKDPANGNSNQINQNNANANNKNTMHNNNNNNNNHKKEDMFDNEKNDGMQVVERGVEIEWKYAPLPERNNDDLLKKQKFKCATCGKPLG